MSSNLLAQYFPVKMVEHPLFIVCNPFQNSSMFKEMLEAFWPTHISQYPSCSTTTILSHHHLLLSEKMQYICLPSKATGMSGMSSPSTNENRPLWPHVLILGCRHIVGQCKCPEALDASFCLSITGNDTIFQITSRPTVYTCYSSLFTHFYCLRPHTDWSHDCFITYIFKGLCEGWIRGRSNAGADLQLDT